MKSLPALSVTVLLSVLALTACNNKPPQPIAKAEPIATPFDGMRAEEQRAKDVQKIVDKQAADQRKQIETSQQ